MDEFRGGEGTPALRQHPEVEFSGLADMEEHAVAELDIDRLRRAKARHVGVSWSVARRLVGANAASVILVRARHIAGDQQAIGRGDKGTLDALEGAQFFNNGCWAGVSKARAAGAGLARARAGAGAGFVGAVAV